MKEKNFYVVSGMKVTEEDTKFLKEFVVFTKIFSINENEKEQEFINNLSNIENSDDVKFLYSIGKEKIEELLKLKNEENLMESGIAVIGGTTAGFNSAQSLLYGWVRTIIRKPIDDPEIIGNELKKITESISAIETTLKHLETAIEKESSNIARSKYVDDYKSLKEYILHLKNKMIDSQRNGLSQYQFVDTTFLMGLIKYYILLAYYYIKLSFLLFGAVTITFYTFVGLFVATSSIIGVSAISSPMVSLATTFAGTIFGSLGLIAGFILLVGTIKNIIIWVKYRVIGNRVFTNEDLEIIKSSKIIEKARRKYEEENNKKESSNPNNSEAVSENEQFKISIDGANNLLEYTMGLYKRSLEIEEKALLSEEINDISSDELEKARKTKSFLEKAIRKASEFSILARLVVAYAYAEVAYIRLLIFFKGLNTFSDITNLFEEWKNIRIGIGKKKSEIMKLKSIEHKKPEQEAKIKNLESEVSNLKSIESTKFSILRKLIKTASKIGKKKEINNKDE
jgi:hypothetical protein